jgi:CRP-like cAMP-binding protein
LSQLSARFRNRLLQSLAPDDLALIAGKLHAERLELRHFFENAEEPIREICFPESAIVSVVARTTAGRSIEAGLIGFEGMTGIAILMGDDRSPNETYVQMAGEGNVMAADDLRSAIRSSPHLHTILLRYAHTFMVQTSQTALANGRAKIDERLARWLLMASDRVEGPELSLTHEFLSLMLGVRRPGVTDALHRLEGEHLIRSRRSSITIRDREGLETVANGSYGVAERDYERLFGSFRVTSEAA